MSSGTSQVQGKKGKKMRCRKCVKNCLTLIPVRSIHQIANKNRLEYSQEPPTPNY